jgi:hypothetical protein
LEKIVVKTAVKTALIVILILLISIGVINFAFPQHVATFAERIGNYQLAVKYTNLRYSYTGDEYDLARLVDDCILSDKDEYIVTYGEKLIDDEGFDEVCEYKNELLKEYIDVDYGQYVAGKVAVSKYNLGDFDGALKLALRINGSLSFKANNAVLALSAKVIENKDRESAVKVVSALGGITTENDGETALLNKLIERLRSII